MAWFSLSCWRYMADALDMIRPFNRNINGWTSDMIELVGFAFFAPLAVLAVRFFVWGFVPGRRAVLKFSTIICVALLVAYIAIVAYAKIDFESPLPIQIACGLTPVLAAFGVMLFYGGRKWRKVLCAVLASLALAASASTFSAGTGHNNRETIGYSKSPGGTHRIVVVRDLSTKWKLCVACPMYGMWYKQDNPEYVAPDVLQNVVWLDEHTAQFSDRNNYPRTITFK